MTAGHLPAHKIDGRLEDPCILVLQALLENPARRSSQCRISGCHVATSNRVGTDQVAQESGGRGWIFGPSGRLRAETTAPAPMVEKAVDLDLVPQAKREYPNYAEDLPAQEVMGLLEIQGESRGEGGTYLPLLPPLDLPASLLWPLWQLTDRYR